MTFFCLFHRCLPILFAALTVYFSSDLFQSFQPDSASYLTFESYRSSGYPIFLNLLKLLGDISLWAAVVQTIIYLCSLQFLLTNLRSQVTQKILWWFCIFMICGNFYYHSYHTVILTESLSFSLVNIVLGCFLRIRERNTLSMMAGLGVALGILVAIKPSTIFLLLCVPLVLIAFPCGRKKTSPRYFLFLLVSMFALTLLERAYHDSKHPDPKSLVSNIILGKVAILSSFEEYEAPVLSDRLSEWSMHIENHYAPFREFATDSSNFLLTKSLRSYFEVFGQFQLNEVISHESNITALSDREIIFFGRDVLLANKLLVLKLALERTMSMWFIADVPFAIYWLGKSWPEEFSTRFAGTLPGSSSGLDFKSGLLSKMSILIFPGFLFLGFINLMVFLWCIFERFCSNMSAFGGKKARDMNFVISLQTIAWGYLVFVSAINIALPRYLMLVYPVFVVALVIFMQLFYSQFVPSSRRSNAIQQYQPKSQRH